MPINASWRDQRRNWHFDTISVAASNSKGRSSTYIQLQSTAALLRLDTHSAQKLANLITTFLDEKRDPTDGFEPLKG